MVFVYVKVNGQLVAILREDTPDIEQQKYDVAVLRLHRSEKGIIALKPIRAAVDLTIYTS